MKIGRNRPNYVLLAIERQYGEPFMNLYRTRRAQGMSYRKIALEFGVSHQTIMRLRRLCETVEDRDAAAV